MESVHISDVNSSQQMKQSAWKNEILFSGEQSRLIGSHVCSSLPPTMFSYANEQFPGVRLICPGKEATRLDRSDTKRAHKKQTMIITQE